MSVTTITSPAAARKPVTTARQTSPSTPPVRFGFTPAFDGIRAIAVTIVVFFHLGWGNLAAGGHTGVAVFFVLSGLLITSGLLHHGSAGTLSFSDFLMRRAARLLPVFVLVVAVVTAVSVSGLGRWLSAQAADPDLILVSALYALTQTSNIALASDQTLAFELVPTWSLATEQQFYLVWPLVILACVWLAKRTSVAILVGTIAAVGACAAFVWTVMLIGAQVSMSRLTFSPEVACGFVLVGALGACMWRHDTIRRWCAATPTSIVLVAAAVVVWALWGGQIGPVTMTVHGYGAPVIAVCTIIVLLAVLAGAGGPLRDVLSMSMLVWLGARSYALYLVHVPMLVWAGGGETSMAVKCGVVAVSVVLAAACYRWVERPAGKNINLWWGSRRARSTNVATAL